MLQDSSDLLNRLLDPVGRCLTRDVAQQIAALRADPAVQERLDTLADRSSEGILSEEERVEYDTFIQAVDFLSVLQAKARARLNTRRDR